MPTEPYSREDISALMLAVQRLCAARDVDTVIDIVGGSARGLIGADGTTFVLREGDQVYYAREDAISPLWQGKRFAADGCISGWVMKNRQSATIPDICVDPRIPLDRYRTTFVRSLAMVPVNREEPIAAIGVYWASAHVTTERELELLRALADAAASAIANSVLYDGLSAARTELEQAGTRLRLALAAGAIGTWDYDPRSGELTWDGKCKELFGVASDAPIDFPLFLRLLHPDDRTRVQAAVDVALAAGSGGRYDGQYRSLPAADGGERWIAARGQVQFDRSGRAERFVGTVRDISDQKLAEAEKAELLRRANAANLAKDEFLAMLGHELRNPLAPIVTAVELLKLRGHAATREVASIERQSQHLVRLVDDLLDIARVTRGKLELKRRRVELQSFVSKAIEIAAPLIERQRHVLEVALEPGVWIDGDEFRLAQLLANLLTNAAKYTPDSGSIRIEAHTQDAQVWLCVRDSGCGIAPELLPRLFAPFVQAMQTSERSQGGLGLGLALARSLAELHGGTIEVESAGPGQGSAFTVRLPILLDVLERKSVPPLAAGAIKPARALEILVVDDNADAAELLAVSLRNRGHRVEVALDPVEALAAVGRSVPDLAFLDIGLPVMDGYELAEHLREQLGANCPVLIAITGYGQERDRRRSAEAGFALHLVKPVQLATVLDAVTQVTPRLEARAD
jgi:PAS domain S-box-containing protein